MRSIQPISSRNQNIHHAHLSSSSENLRKRGRQMWCGSLENIFIPLVEISDFDINISCMTMTLVFPRSRKQSSWHCEASSLDHGQVMMRHIGSSQPIEISFSLWKPNPSPVVSSGSHPARAHAFFHLRIEDANYKAGNWEAVHDHKARKQNYTCHWDPSEASRPLCFPQETVTDFLAVDDTCIMPTWLAFDVELYSWYG